MNIFVVWVHPTVCAPSAVLVSVCSVVGGHPFVAVCHANVAAVAVCASAMFLLPPHTTACLVFSMHRHLGHPVVALLCVCFGGEEWMRP